MKFAMIDGNRHEAAPGLSGTCPIYGHPMIARCGEVRMWHWAHQGSRSCDPWWESETEWHREWKGRFPKEWQEIIHHSGTGEKHIADVKTGRGWIIEFQHSRISPEERRSRDSFYGRLIWVVDGLRRKKDADQFRDAWNAGMPIVQNATIRRVLPERCALLREWSGCASHVFIDFGGQSNLWWLFSKGPDKPTYIACFSRPEFLGIHRGEMPEKAATFEDTVEGLERFVAQCELQLARAQSRFPSPLAYGAPPRRRF